jgi:hypothetical protein
MLEHYQLSLLTRCVDEGFQPHNRRAIEPIVRQFQLSFLRLYQMAKAKELVLIKSPFFSAYKISPNLCMSEKQDLYELIPEPSKNKDKCFLLACISTIRVVTPKVLDSLVALLTDKKPKVRCSAAEAVGKLRTAATPKVLDALVALLTDKKPKVRRSAVEAVGKLGTAVTPKLLDALLGLLAHERNDVRNSAATAVGKLGAAATPKLLDALQGLLTDKDRDVRSSAAYAVGELGSAAIPKLLDALVVSFSDETNDVRHAARTRGASIGDRRDTEATGLAGGVVG